jgi:hypothetical protein
METDYRLTIDKLEVTYKATEETRAFISGIDTITDNQQTFILQRINNKKGTYKHYFIVQYATGYNDVTGWSYETLGTLYFGSYNQNRQHFYFEFENKAHYTDGFAYACLHYITSYIGLEYYQVSKLDLAWDCNRDVVKQIYRICKNDTITLEGEAMQYDVVMNGKKISLTDNSPILWMCNGRRENPIKNKGIVLHNGKRSISMRGYNKGDEIKASNKDYIQGSWEGRNMYRLEVSFSNASEINKVLTDICHTANKSVYTELLLSNMNNPKFLYLLYFQALESLIYVTTSKHRKKEKLNIVFFALNSLEMKAKLLKKGRIKSIC